jgi:hypothetical protein
MSWVFSTSYVVYAFTSKSIGVTVLSEMDGPLGVEIEPTYGLESLGKFLCNQKGGCLT